jgi:phosphoglycerate dehydrogenase-like enzyme
MKALVIAECTAAGIGELEAMGYEVAQQGWGVTGVALEGQELLDAASGVHLIVCELEHIDEHVLDAAPELNVIAACRGNPVNVDVEEATRRGVLVLNTPGRNAASVADFTIGAMIGLVRNMSAGERHLRTVGWNVEGRLPYLTFRGPELAGRTLGLVGYGAIGRLVAQRARDGFGMRIAVHDPYATHDPDVDWLDLDELANQATVLSLHAPVTADTRGMIGGAQLEALGPTGYLINTARADLVQESALLAALQDRRIGGAALDVFWKEPLPRDHPLLELDNVMITPHIAGAADDVRRHHTQMIIDDLKRIAAGRQPHRLVNAAANQGTE